MEIEKLIAQDEGCPLLLLSEDDKMCYKEDGVLLFNDEMEFEVGSTYIAS